MANYHVLEVSPKGNRAQVAFHFTVGAGTNFAGKSWQSVLVEYLSKNSSEARAITQVPWLETGNATEHTALTNGGVYEVVESVSWDGNATNSEKAAVIDARWTALNATTLSELQEQLTFWGLDRNVV